MNWRRVMVVFATWLACYTVVSSYVSAAKIALEPTFHFNSCYFYGRKILPFAFFTVFLFSYIGLPNLYEKIFDEIAICLFTALSLLLGFLIVNFVNGAPFASVFTYHWQYAGNIEWIVAVVASTLLFSRKVKFYLSLVVSYLVMFFGGFLYELPLIVFRGGKVNWIHHSHPLLLATEVFSIPIMVFMLFTFKWRPNLLFFLLLAVWWVSHALLLLFPLPPLRVYDWIPRLPTIALLLSIPFGVKKFG